MPITTQDQWHSFINLADYKPYNLGYFPVLNLRVLELKIQKVKQRSPGVKFPIIGLRSHGSPTYQVSSISDQYFPSYPVFKVHYHFSRKRSISTGKVNWELRLTGILFTGVGHTTHKYLKIDMPSRIIFRKLPINTSKG